MSRRVHPSVCHIRTRPQHHIKTQPTQHSYDFPSRVPFPQAPAPCGRPKTRSRPCWKRPASATWRTRTTRRGSWRSMSRVLFPPRLGSAASDACVFRSCLVAVCLSCVPSHASSASFFCTFARSKFLYSFSFLSEEAALQQRHASPYPRTSLCVQPHAFHHPNVVVRFVQFLHGDG